MVTAISTDDAMKNLITNMVNSIKKPLKVQMQKRIRVDIHIGRQIVSFSQS